MTIYQKALAQRAPELNALHMETLAFAVGSTLNGMPKEFFDEIAALARRTLRNNERRPLVASGEQAAGDRSPSRAGGPLRGRNSD